MTCTRWKTCWLSKLTMTKRLSSCFTMGSRTRFWGLTPWIWPRLARTPSSRSQLSRLLRQTQTTLSLASCKLWIWQAPNVKVWPMRKDRLSRSRLRSTKVCLHCERSSQPSPKRITKKLTNSICNRHHSSKTEKLPISHIVTQNWLVSWKSHSGGTVQRAWLPVCTRQISSSKKTIWR